MSRVYITPSWIGAAEDWSGDSPDNRKCSSTELYLPNGKANTKAFADDAPKAKAKRSVRYKIIPQQTRLDNIEKMQQELEEEYAEGAMSAREYAELSLVLTKKHDRAYQLLAKAMGWKEEDEQETPAAYTWTESKAPVCEKDSIFLSLPVDNIFRRCYDTYTQAKMTLKSLKG